MCWRNFSDTVLDICETASYQSTFRRSKQQHSKMHIMTQLRVLSMRIAEVPGRCETSGVSESIRDDSVSASEMEVES